MLNCRTPGTLLVYVLIAQLQLGLFLFICGGGGGGNANGVIFLCDRLNFRGLEKWFNLPSQPQITTHKTHTLCWHAQTHHMHLTMHMKLSTGFTHILIGLFIKPINKAALLIQKIHTIVSFWQAVLRSTEQHSHGNDVPRLFIPTQWM